jgi:hypothetical protein
MGKPLRALAGWTVGLSVSDTAETSIRGFPAAEINRIVLRIVSALLGQGAAVSFGHDWRDDGVMEAVHGYVERFRPAINEHHSSPMLWNFVPLRIPAKPVHDSGVMPVQRSAACRSRIPAKPVHGAGD